MRYRSCCLLLAGLFLFVSVSCTQINYEPVEIPMVRKDMPGNRYYYNDMEHDFESFKKDVSFLHAPEAKDQNGKTLLIHAAEKGCLDAARLLLKLGANPNERGDCILCKEDGRRSGYESKTPLHWAAEKGNLAMVRLLVEHGADVALKDNTGRDAYQLTKNDAVQKYLFAHYDEKTQQVIKLSEALAAYCSKPDLPMMKKLIDSGADVNRADWASMNPLYAASDLYPPSDMPREKSFAAIKLLIENGADVNSKAFGKFDSTLLFEAVDRKDKHDLARFLLNHGADPNIKNTSKKKTALHIAAQNGYIEMADELLKHGADINALSDFGETPITQAAAYNKKEMVEFLLLHGADVNLFKRLGNTPLTAKIFEKDPAINALTFEKGPGINEKTNPMGYTYLHGAVAKGDMKLVEELLEKGADVNVNDTFWKGKPPKNPRIILFRTPLHFAADHYTAWGLIDLLLTHGANINARDNWGMTPLHLAVLDSRPGATKKLIAKGADVNVKNYKGETPLLLAAWDENKKIVPILIKAGADVNAKDFESNTPLHRAAEKGHRPIVEMLVKAGADINAKNNAGQTPLAVVGFHRIFTTTKEYLIENGATK